jgi:preprotein translocase SecE subunit
MNSDIQTAPAKEKAKKRSFFLFLQELKDELKKVSWTTQAELKVSVKVVIVSTFLFGFCVYLADLVIKMGLQGIGSLARLLFG